MLTRAKGCSSDDDRIEQIYFKVTGDRLIYCP